MSTNSVRSESGYSAIELIVMLVIIAVLTTIAALQVGASLPAFRGDGGMRVLASQMTTARELAIAERRYMRVTFTAPNLLQIVREEVPGPTTTVVKSVVFESGVQYLLVTGVPDTPDGFGRSAAVSFGTVTNVKFSPDGTLVNQDGVSVNGTVFLAISGAAPLSARAVTVLGSTGRVRAYKWNGRQWKLA